MTVTRRSSPDARRLPIGKQILFSTILVCAVLVLLEGTIRLWAYYFRTSYERYNWTTGRLELVPNIRYTTASGSEFWINSRGFVGPEFDDVYRIMAVGDSCTFTTGAWKIGYPSVLERSLNDGSPFKRFEVINAGIEGYNSGFALDRIRRELIRYRPRLVIIYVGWNDLMKTDPSSSASDRYRLLAQIMNESYLIKAYKKLIFMDLRPRVSRPTFSTDPRDVHAYDTFVPADYRSNLQDIVRVLRDHDTKVMFATLPTVVRPEMTLDELQRSRVFFPYFVGAYDVSRFLSLHQAYNRTIREIASREHVELVDLAAAFDTLETKTEYFWDTMHPNAKGNALIAASLFRRVRELESVGRL
jgi:lysophospholipase L1-like esterase